jgi:uncharacterized protein (DUF885 family)
MTHHSHRHFCQFVDQFLDDFFASHPESATASGVHDYDDMISDFSLRGIARQVTGYRRALTKFKKLGLSGRNRSTLRLPPQFHLEVQLLEGSMEAAVFDLEEMRPWERDPNYYNEILHHSLFSLVQRNFAPLNRRVRAMIERQRQIPAALENAKTNLHGVPKMVAQVAVRQLEGTLHFLRTSLPSAVYQVKDPDLLARFEKSNALVIQAYSRFLDHLKRNVIPRGEAQFGIGERLYRKKLWVDEMVDLPLDKLLAIAYESLAENHEHFRSTAAEIDSRRRPEEILQRMTRKHPPANQLISSIAAVLDQLRDFLITNEVISLPPIRREAGLCTVDESPEFLRALTFASLEVPGALEKKSREYYYHVTLPDPEWPPAKQEQHLRFFSHDLILTTSIHEAYPGHLLHFLWVNRHPSKIRRLFGSTSHVEGWAHYCEQMMLEAGYGEGNHKLLLAQLHEAQLRLCRFIVGIEMHVNDMSFQRAKNFFIRHALMEPVNAEREAKRGVVDPTYLVYTLGKMQFLRLREDLKQKQGEKFSLKKFHNDCVQNGFPPIPLLRELLLGERRAVL